MKLSWEQKVNSITKKEGIGNNEFARMIGVSPGTVSFWINNVNTPRPVHIIKIATTFRWLNIYWLLDMEENMERKQSETELLHKIAEMQQQISLHEKLLKLLKVTD